MIAHLEKLGIRVRDKLGQQRTTCPQCSHTRKKKQDQCLSVLIDADGATFKCWNCDWFGTSSENQRTTGRPIATPSCRIVHHAERIDDGTLTKSRLIWNEAIDARGTVVETYLASRGLTLPECGDYAIRYHAGCPWERGRLPAMVAAFRSIDDDRIITGIHRTALTADGEKIGRKMLGSVKGSAIMLDPSEVVATSLSIAEGIESGLAGRLLGWRPCWALGSAGGIASFPLLSGIECLNLLAETDDANARARVEAGNRWYAEGREVKIISPKDGGDLNDALRRCA